MPERTPLYEQEAEAGAVFADEAGWLVPAHFGDRIAEYRTARQGAAIFDLSHWGKIELTGPDARMFLHNLCTNDVKGLSPGIIREAFLATVQARVIAHVFIHARDDDSLWLNVGPGMAEKVIKHLDRHLISEQVEIIDHTHDYAQLRLIGPATTALRNDSVAHQLLNLPGSDIFLPRGPAGDVWKELRAKGARPAGLLAYEILRVEAGMPVYGTDMDENVLVPEVGRTPRAVSYTKGCYLGQEPIVRIRDLGHVNRSLLGLKVAGAGAITTGAKLYRDGKEVGTVGSSVESPELETIALAWVRRGNEPGSTVEIEADGSKRIAEVVGLPFSIGGGTGT
jgi:folate-binding protein YgfZ